MIDATAVSFLFSTLAGCWALGFGLGKAVAYTRAIRGAA